jgi:hypothetical protein
MHSSDGAACAGRLGVGLAVVGFARVADVDLTVAFAVGRAFLGDARRTGAFFTDFFLAFAVVLRVVPLVASVFLRFTLALPLDFFLVAIYSLPQVRRRKDQHGANSHPLLRLNYVSDESADDEYQASFAEADTDDIDRSYLIIQRQLEDADYSCCWKPIMNLIPCRIGDRGNSRVSDAPR